MTFLAHTAADLRATPRFPRELPLAAHLLDHDLLLSAEDVSRDGVFIRSPNVPPLGHALHLSLKVDGVHTLEAVATVVRVVPGRGFGARLNVVGREGRQQWASFLASLAQPERHEAHPPLLRELDPRDVFDFSWTNDADETA